MFYSKYADYVVDLPEINVRRTEQGPRVCIKLLWRKRRSDYCLLLRVCNMRVYAEYPGLQK